MGNLKNGGEITSASASTASPRLKPDTLSAAPMTEQSMRELLKQLAIEAAAQAGHVVGLPGSGTPETKPRSLTPVEVTQLKDSLQITSKRAKSVIDVAKEKLEKQPKHE
jgi:hypothetical protein